MAQRRKAGGTGEERRADLNEVVLGAAKQEPADQQQRTSETDSRAELGDTVGSGWVVTLALALFLYNLLLALDYPVGRWAQSVGALGGWAALFPPAADEWSWRLPEPLIRVPLGGSAEPRVESAFLSPPEGSALLTLAGSRPVKALGPEERTAAERAAAARGEAFNPTDDAMARDAPVVMRSLLSAADWPALSRWTPEHIARHMPTIRPHISSRPAIRMHTAAAPMGRLEGVRWPRPWEERELPTAEFLRGEHPRAYLFLHGKQLPRALREDLGKRPRCCRHLGCILPKRASSFVACGQEGWSCSACPTASSRSSTPGSAARASPPRPTSEHSNGRLGPMAVAVALTADRCCETVTLCTTPTSRSPGGSASFSSPPTATTISTSSRGCTL